MGPANAIEYKLIQEGAQRMIRRFGQRQPCFFAVIFRQGRADFQVIAGHGAPAGERKRRRLQHTFARLQDEKPQALCQYAGRVLLVDGQPPKVEIIDARTIKYSWDKPNPYFIESQARAAPASGSAVAKPASSSPPAR